MDGVVLLAASRLASASIAVATASLVLIGSLSSSDSLCSI